MTTPDTSAVRAWARSNGYDVADRGRLPAELTDAYLAAQGGKAAPAKKATGKKATTKAAAARKAAPARSAKAAPKTAAKTAAPKGAAKTAPKPVAKTAPKPSAKAAAAPVAETAAPASAAASSAPVTAKTAEPKPTPVNDDRRLVALGEQLTALTARVAELEKAAGSKPVGHGVAKRFRRSR